MSDIVLNTAVEFMYNVYRQLLQIWSSTEVERFGWQRFKVRVPYPNRLQLQRSVKVEEREELLKRIAAAWLKYLRERASEGAEYVDSEYEYFEGINYKSRQRSPFSFTDARKIAEEP